MASTKPYRTLQPKTFGDSSSEEGELSSDISDSDDICRKRLKISGDDHATSEGLDVFHHSEVPMQHSQRKRNNIWGSVLADQTSNDISSSMGTVGLKRILARGPESFSLELATGGDRQRLEESSSSEDEIPKNGSSETPFDLDIENYLVERHLRGSAAPTVVPDGATRNALKRKRPQKKKKTGHVPRYKPGQKVKLNRKHELSPDDSEEKVAEELTFRLWEKKKDLIRHVVTTIGIPKALFLYEKTEALELSGGLMTLKGNRRRTPGGTFLHLLRKDEDIDQESKIFEAESLREKAQWMAAKQAKRGSAGQHDVGETPHNSPSATRDQLVSDADSPAKIEMDCNSSRTQCLADASVTSGLVDEEPSNSYGLETFG